MTIINALIERIKTEPALFWGAVASIAVAIYHLVNPAGDKDTIITDLVTTLGPIIVGALIRPNVTPNGAVVPPAG